MSEPHYPRYETDLERRTQPGTVFRKTGKVLSICSDRPTAPFTTLIYRFGVIGNVELERVANKSSPFYGVERGGSPHAGEDILFFRIGQYTYCVSEATGQGSGISLTVLKGGQEVVSLFSGNSRGTDYETGLLDLSFGSNKSPAIRAALLKNDFQTPCDGKRLMLP